MRRLLLIPFVVQLVVAVVNRLTVLRRESYKRSR